MSKKGVSVRWMRREKMGRWIFVFGSVGQISFFLSFFL